MLGSAARRGTATTSTLRQFHCRKKESEQLQGVCWPYYATHESVCAAGAYSCRRRLPASPGAQPARRGWCAAPRLCTQHGSTPRCMPCDARDMHASTCAPAARTIDHAPAAHAGCCRRSMLSGHCRWCTPDACCYKKHASRHITPPAVCQRRSPHHTPAAAVAAAAPLCCRGTAAVRAASRPTAAASRQATAAAAALTPAAARHRRRYKVQTNHTHAHAPCRRCCRRC